MASPDNTPPYYPDEHRTDLGPQQGIAEDVEGNSSGRSGDEVQDNLEAINNARAEDSMSYRQN